MSWTIEFHEDFDREFQGFNDRVQDEILAKLIVLEKEGPNLGRPHSDTLNGSAHSNMKELRVSAAGGIWCIAFAFAPGRNAILVAAGDKRGANEDGFYRDPIRLADSRFAGHLAT
jgi:hypothetical protein